MKLSRTSKMPCHSYGHPYCRTGSKLRCIPDTVCSNCYVHTYPTTYLFPSTKRANLERFEALSNPLWDIELAVLIEEAGEDYFRWHDIGDIVNLQHYRAICRVASLTPHVKHWLPTKEWYLTQYLGEKPKNLTVRFSLFFLEQDRPPTLPDSVLTSGVASANWICPASKQDGKCLRCRMCWEDSKHIVYHFNKKRGNYVS